MQDLLSPEHKITERKYMQFQPFGVGEKGKKIEDVRGHSISKIIDRISETARKRMEESNTGAPPQAIKERAEGVTQEAVERFVSMLNSAIRDKKFHVTRESLKNPWNSYSTEFFHFAIEFAKEITDEKDFCFKLGLYQIITPTLAIVAKIIPLEYCYRIGELEERLYTKVVRMEIPFITKGRAIIQIKVAERYKEVTGEYFLACAENTCQIRKGAILSAPQRIHNMPIARMKEIKCMIKGDEYCEMEVTWETAPSAGRGFLLLGMSSSLALFVVCYSTLECVALKFLIPVFPLTLGFYLAKIKSLASEKEGKDRLVADQQKYLEERFKELESTNIQLQSTNVELNEKLLQLAEAQERLIHAEKLAALGRLSSYVSHELRNPLTSIKNAIFYLKRKIPQSPLAKEDTRLTEFLEILDKEVETSTNIVNHILDFAKIKKPTLDKAELPHALKFSLSRRAIPKGVKIIEEVPTDLPSVWVDAGQIAIVFGNLIQNAYEAMPQGGVLKIIARPNREFVEVEFTDTGHGIPEEDLKKVFEHFFTSKSTGTGIGLSICKEIVERHGGNITLQSKLGAGSTFSVRLPVAVS